jgi:hypothetical protein
MDFFQTVYSDLYILVLSINDLIRSMGDLYPAREGKTRKRVATRLKQLAVSQVSRSELIHCMALYYGARHE